jgi:hypothetical protein
MLILSIFLYRKSSKYFTRKTCSKYSRRVRTTAPPVVARLNTEIPCITNLSIYSNIYGFTLWVYRQILGFYPCKMVSEFGYRRSTKIDRLRNIALHERSECKCAVTMLVLGCCLPYDRDAADRECVVFANRQRCLQRLRAESFKAHLIQLIKAVDTVHS